MSEATLRNICQQVLPDICVDILTTKEAFETVCKHLWPNVTLDCTSLLKKAQ